MAIVSLSCGAQAPASNALKALIKVLGLDTDLKVEVVESLSPFASVSTSHVLTGLTSTTKATTWVDCCRTLSQQVPSVGLFGTSSQEEALVISWLETAADSLVPILSKGAEQANDSDASSVQAFVIKLEDWLFGKEYTYLVSDSPTAADICVGLWLAQACEIVSLDTLSQQSFRLLISIANHPALKEFAPASLPQQGVSIPPAPAPAVAPLEETAVGDFADNTIVQRLAELKLEHSVYMHELCVTAEELVAKVPLPSDDETHTKNLFLRDKKHGNFLITLHPDTKVNTKDLGTMLKLSGKTNLRMATPDILLDLLGCQPGTVGPLAIINDVNKEVTLILDQALLTKTKIHSHPFRNDASVILTPAALQEYIQLSDHEAVILEFPTVVTPTSDDGKAPATTKVIPPKTAKAASNAAPVKNKDKKNVEKGKTLLALGFKKEENFSMWYSDVITLAEMISYYDISGCYILRPWSYKMWEMIQEWFNKEIGPLGVENCYFPLFVTQDRLEKEKDHVEGFAPEVAWVTRSGDGELAKPIAIRPTSETIMYPSFSDWIKSHRDLPLKLNQWSNVVRWEFKYPTPFLRSREFLWQEGHTAHANYEDANVMVLQALELYRRVYEELLAVPVIPGYKTEEEKFAGGMQTTTVEAYVPVAGRAIQGATSHNLGQNFGKMFDIKFQDHEGKTETAWQTSWGLTTRTIGVMVMVHGDNVGLVLPPRISPLQCVIVPITSKNMSMDDVAVYCKSIATDLSDNGIRAKFDDRTIYNPGWKYNHWEQKGVPIRIEIGPRDVEEQQARIVVRYNGEKVDMPIAGLGAALVVKLEEIQHGLFEKAKKFRDDHLVQVTEWKDFVPNLEKHNLVLTPWCGGEHKDWEEWVKNKSREESLAASGEAEEDVRTSTSVAAKTLCIPFNQPELPPGTKCFASGKDAKCWVLWGRSY